MFAIPKAKRVKRPELSEEPGPDNSEATTSDVENDENEPYSFTYDLIPPTNTSAEPTTTSSNTQDSPSQLPFQLFASTAPTNIIVRPLTPPPEVPLSEGRFIRPSRPAGYYLTSEVTPDEATQRQQQFNACAIGGNEVLKGLSRAWPGVKLKWKVIHVNRAGGKANAAAPALDQGLAGTEAPRKAEKRSRPNRKRRIAVRRRIAARQSVKQKAVFDEEAERIKRNVRNREKKIKRRERERKKKAEAREGMQHNELVW
jgi:hypothetical protein